MSNIHLNVALLDIAREGLSDSSPEAAAIKRRYALILSILSSNGTEPVIGENQTSPMRRPYSETERREVDQIFKTFSPLYISVSNLNEQGQPTFSEVKAKQHLPWAGYWYPMRDGRLYNSNQSPLAKFDAMAAALGRQTKTLEVQQKKHDSLAISWSLWDGHCDAWANAALITPEPKKPVTKNGQLFLVSDIKALLILKYAGFPLDVYGRTYRGSHETDGEIQDVRPEAFHRLVEHFIGEKGVAIGVDDDPEPAIWNKPMASMRWKVISDPDNKHAFLVQAFPLLINNRNEPSEDLTDPNAFDRNDVKRPKWEYRLFYDPSDLKDGKYRVIYGEWINGSRVNHPDIVFVPKTDAAPNPRNSEIAKNIDLIDAIVSESLR